MLTTAQKFWWLLSQGGGTPFDPQSLVDDGKIAAWYKGETDDYIIDQLGFQEREVLTQNSLAGQVFSGRGYNYVNNTDTTWLLDNGALAIQYDYTVCFNVTFNTFLGFTRFAGKIKDGNLNTIGENYFSTGSNSLIYNVRTDAGLFSIAGFTVVTGVKYHVMITITAGGTMQLYLNNVATGSPVAVSGNFAALPDTCGYIIHGVNSTSGIGYNADVDVTDFRIFYKALNSTERALAYQLKRVGGERLWLMMSDKNTARCHDASGNGYHFGNNGFDSNSFITGYWRQPYNDYGYAEDATWGQIPPDMSTVVDEVPQDDVLGNPLIFKGAAKQNLIKSGTDVTIFDGAISDYLTTLIRATKQIGRDQWFSGTTAQAISAASAAKYCGALQYYNPATKELIIVKVGHDDENNAYALTAVEEANLMSYMGLSTSDVPTDYSSQMTAFLARCSGTYSNELKNILDNFFRVNEISTAEDEIETINAACWGTGTDRLLDLYNATFNVVDASLGRVDLVDYKGLVPQDGSYKNGFVPSASSKFLQNDASIFFVVGDEQICPSLYSVMGSDNTGVSGVFARFSQGGTSLQLNHFLNDAAGSFTDVPSGVFNNDAFIINRIASGANGKNIYANNQLIASVTSTSAARPSVEMHLGIRRTGTGSYITHDNYVAICGAGGAMSAAVSAWFTDTLYTLKSTMYARANEWLYTSDGEVRYKRVEYPYFPGCISEDGVHRMWHDYYNIYYTNDGNGTHAVTSSMAFNQNTLGWIHMGKMYDDGTFLFATNKNKVYLSSTALESYEECAITKNGSPYTIHTPVNAQYPGEYFKFLGIYRKQVDDEGNEIFVYSNYSLSARGAAPGLLFYHRPSFGAELKVVYEFGQSEFFTDNGTPNGGTGGTPVGDASEMLWCRHTHGTVQLPGDRTKFYMVTGDHDHTPGQYEFDNHHILFTADFDTGIFTKDVLFSGTRVSIAKAGSPDIHPDDPDFASIETDDTGGGLYTFDPNTVTGPESFTLVFDQEASEFNTHVPLWGMIDKKNGVYRYVGLGFVRTPPASGEFSFPSIIHSMNMHVADSYIPEAKRTPGNVLPTVIQHIGNNRYMIWNAEYYDFFAGAQCEIIEFVN